MTIQFKSEFKRVYVPCPPEHESAWWLAMGIFNQMLLTAAYEQGILGPAKTDSDTITVAENWEAQCSSPILAE